MPSRAYARDTVTLGWEDRTQCPRPAPDGWRRRVWHLAAARDVLRDGDCFILDEERLVVAIVERPEPVFVIEPRTAPEWALFAYHIGNRHQPVMITDRSLVCPDVPGVEQLLQQHHMPHRARDAPVHAGDDGRGTSALRGAGRAGRAGGQVERADGLCRAAGML